MPAGHEEGIASYYFEVLGKPEAYRKGSGKAAIVPNSKSPSSNFQIPNYSKSQIPKIPNSKFQIPNSKSAIRNPQSAIT
jgi:hypothetical protein